MNLSPRPSTPFLIPLCVIGGGLSLANCVQITELYALYGERWMGLGGYRVYDSHLCAYPGYRRGPAPG